MLLWVGIIIGVVEICKSFNGLIGGWVFVVVECEFVVIEM